MKKKIITILSTSVILSTFISALTLNANTELSSQNNCKDFQKFVLTKGYDYNYKYDLNTNGTINVLDLCRQKKYELIKNNITTTTTTKVTTPVTTITTSTTKITTTPVTTTTKPQTTTKVTTTTAPPPVTTTVQTTPIDTSSWKLTIQQIEDSAKLINSIRANKGAGELKIDYSLCAAANQRAKELNISFSNTRPDGSSYRTLYEEFGANYYTRGYVSGQGYSSYSMFINDFSSSNVLLNTRYVAFGIGYDPNGKTWAILFGV